MRYPTYYIVELTKDVESNTNDRNYSKGVRKMVREDSDLGCYWVVNSNDTFAISSAKKIYKLDVAEI